MLIFRFSNGAFVSFLLGVYGVLAQPPRSPHPDFAPRPSVTCLKFPEVDDSISQTTAIDPVNLNVKVDTLSQDFICFNNYFSSPQSDFNSNQGQPLSYTLVLCDNNWHPIPGWTVNQASGWVTQQNKLQPYYVSFAPKNSSHLGVYPFAVIASNGTASVNATFVVNVFQFQDSRDYVIDWLNTWIGAAGVLGSVGVSRQAFDSLKEDKLLKTEKWGAISWALTGFIGGGAIGAPLGWLGELGALLYFDNKKSVYNFGSVVMGASTALAGFIGAFFLYKSYQKSAIPVAGSAVPLNSVPVDVQ
ncbi:MAG: hypothetical protein I8H75_05290 [Myxococcaceae bacterium]|nr:hypothetical protein [Myxococcaceae bacterium]MBH2006734.1 hypothetical protein [Myxococcaceae bacterium]